MLDDLLELGIDLAGEAAEALLTAKRDKKAAKGIRSSQKPKNLKAAGGSSSGKDPWERDEAAPPWEK